MDYEPLRITALLRSTIAGDFTLPIDGILAATACIVEYDMAVAYEPGVPLPYDPDIVPLLRLGSEEWFFAASFANWPAQKADGVLYWNKRLDSLYAEELTELRGINVSAGTFKMYHHPIPYRSAISVSWDVFGNARHIEKLLRIVSSIGKKQAQGFGAVREWKIVRLDTGYSVYNADGSPARTIPLSYLQAEGLLSEMPFNIGYRGYRPPYWATENQAQVAVPWTG